MHLCCFSVNGGLSQWSQFGPCTKSCGGGVRMRHRQCNNPRPRYGGKDCDESDIVEIQSCGIRKCPVQIMRRKLRNTFKTRYRCKAVTWSIIHDQYTCELQPPKQASSTGVLSSSPPSHAQLLRIRGRLNCSTYSTFEQSGQQQKSYRGKQEELQREESGAAY